MSTEGMMKAEICAKWGIHRDTLHDWSHQKDRPEFSDAIKRGREARAAWWVGFAKKQAKGFFRNGNSIMTIFLMKNICPEDFKDRVPQAEGLEIDGMEFDE